MNYSLTDVNNTGCNTAKVICFVDKILELIGSKCRDCQLQCNVTTRMVGCTLEVRMECSDGHRFTWASSPTMRNDNRRVIYKSNLIFASALLLSGNNYYKIHRFCSFMKMRCISPSTFFTYQRMYLCPVISNFYTKTMVNYNSICYLHVNVCFLELYFAGVFTEGSSGIW